MKFTIISTLALCAFSSAADSSLDVGSVISSFYPTTPSLKPAASTSLASLLNSIETSWHSNSYYTSANAAIQSAAPSSLQASISKSGYDYKEIVTESWYTKNVPHAVQTAVAAQISAVDSAGAKIVGTPTSTNAAPVVTGMGIAGVMGVVGVLAAL